MAPVLIVAIVFSVIGYAMLFHAGINGLRIAWMLRMGWPGYAWLGGVWLWISLMGSWGLFVSVRTLTTLGRPLEIVYERGTEPVVLAGRQWINFIGGFVVCTFVWLMTTKTLQQLKRDFAETNKAMMSLKRTIDAGRR